MELNTAILYDIENLIGGYAKADMLSNLSLKDIYDEILHKEIGKIAIQKAYANWSDSRLNILRGDIIELGIEPIQMFGFGRGPQKNACDIQLAIDAIDIAFTRKAIKIFIIVSGDGGFSSLAKKLHEYGCMVIGCAFRRTTNRIFQAVCDDFIWIDEPKDEYNQNQESNDFSDPILIDYAKKYPPIHANEEQIFEESAQILNFLAENKNASYLLKNVGLNISFFSQALSHRITDFNYLALGFTKFVDFIRYVSNDSKSENKTQYQDLLLGDMIEKLSAEYNYEQNDIKNCVLSLVAAQCFLRKPEDAKISEQNLSFTPHSSEQTINLLQGAMYRKLEQLLGEVKDEIFREILS